MQQGLASQLGGISLGMHTEGVTSARHPYTCGSIPQHNTLQHRGSMEPVMRGKMGLPKQSHVRAFPLSSGSRGMAHHNRPAEDLVGHVFQNFLWIPFGDHPLKLERYRED